MAIETSIRRMVTKRPTAAWFATFLVILGAMALLRWPLYVTSQALRLGWNSDTAIYGLMARAMVETRRPIFFFWGQDYLGTLTSMWTIAIAPFCGGIGPLALRIAAVVQIAVALALFANVLLRAWGKTAAAAAILWLISGPEWFFEMTYAPLSAEQMFLMGALILWYASRQPFARTTQWFVLGLLGGLGWWAHRGSMFAFVPAVVTIAASDDDWRSPERLSRAVAAAIAGLAAGLLPLGGGYLQVDQRLYQPVTSAWTVGATIGQVAELLRTDGWVFLSGSTKSLDLACAVVMLILIAIGCRGAGGSRSGRMLLGVALLAFLFWVISPEAYSGAPRYLMLALPIAYGIAGRGAAIVLSGSSRFLKVVVCVVVCLVAANLCVGRARDVIAIAAGEGEDFRQWQSPDPRAPLAEIARGGYSVCYADFWTAYKLEWLSETNVKFIPHRSVNRTQQRSLILADSSGRKCFVSDGDVKALSPAEERTMRSYLMRSVRGH